MRKLKTWDSVRFNGFRRVGTVCNNEVNGKVDVAIGGGIMRGVSVSDLNLRPSTNREIAAADRARAARRA